MNFEAWPKIYRLYSERGIIITEKIDGTNAAVVINDEGQFLGAQSRKRVITPEQDNFGFARWAYDNAESLAEDLGPGRHFGEWWGSGIQVGYGLPKGEKRFSLFNTLRWNKGGSPEFATEGLDLVPELYRGVFSEDAVKDAITQLEDFGSAAAPGFGHPEGIVVFHVDARMSFKYTPWDGDGKRAEKAQTRG